MAKEEFAEVQSNDIVDWKRFTVIKLKPGDKYDFVYRFTTNDGKITDYGFYKSDLSIGEKILYSVGDQTIIFVEGVLVGIATHYFARKIADVLKKCRNSQK